MAQDSELYRKGMAKRRQLMGDAAVEASAKGVYSDPVMQKFLDVAVENVFGNLWTRPGLDDKTRALICVISDTCTGPRTGTRTAPAHGAAPGLDRGRADRGAAAPVGLYRRADHPRVDAWSPARVFKEHRGATGGR